MNKCPNGSASATEHVRKYLDCSTGCLPHDEFGAMQSNERVICRAHPYGAWVWVPPAYCDDTHDVSKELPNLHALLLLARSLDCSWINFDQDAEAIDELPYFGW